MNEKKELKLIECLAEVTKLPFRVKVTKGGGKFVQGQLLTITEVGTRSYGENAGQVTYDFRNDTTGGIHTDWRHTSEARFELLGNQKELPAEFESLVATFGCYAERVRQLVHLLLPKSTS